MSLLRGANPAKDSQIAESHQWYSLPELYALIENFNKDSKKSNVLKTHSISFKEAQKLLTKSLNAMLFISRTGVRREDPQPVFMCTTAKKEQEKPPCMAELLHCSLLKGLHSPAPWFPRSQKRLTEDGIPLPMHPFPYNVIQDGLDALSWATPEKTQTPQVLDRSHLLKQVFEDKISRYFLVDPEKQFMDLRDLEWRYFKGLAKWKHTTVVSFVDIKYNSEKRFVKRRDMSDVISVPLIRKSLVIYPCIDYQEEGKYDLEWNI
ncbi:uncharacterized protein C9orf153 homolog [Fukomys damarensis]|uniref:uncharacterized protein C9orf153 homolog n=1 Tax=Fukomys damarensis TaxID=885580 RepID=UPI00053FE9A3|nr:uncharacterized protein C9orf153 homolog [Fukomys damarensis]